MSASITLDSNQITKEKHDKDKLQMVYLGLGCDNQHHPRGNSLHGDVCTG